MREGNSSRANRAVDGAHPIDAERQAPSVAFTPGPWSLEVGDHTHSYVKVSGSDERTVHYQYIASRDYPEVIEANARLIAAAPELLEALREAEGLPELVSEIADLEAYGSDDDASVLRALRKNNIRIRAAIRAAIAKATETPPPPMRPKAVTAPDAEVSPGNTPDLASPYRED